jgi:Ca-activated chloride channel family protein
MRFLAPIMLWLLIPAAILVGAYLRRSAQRQAVVLSLLLLGLTLLIFGLARPQIAVSTLNQIGPRVMLLIDVSRSMNATDVLPSRLDAAKVAATTFIDMLPSNVRVGLVSFAVRAELNAAPTLDRAKIRSAIRALTATGGTAAGDAVQLALKTLQSERREGAADAPLENATIVLLSDGASNNGVSIETAGTAATVLKVPVFTIAFGTPDGTIDGKHVPPDVPSMRTLAETTNGTFSEAANAATLQAIYKQLGSQIGRNWRGFGGMLIWAGLAISAVATFLMLARHRLSGARDSADHGKSERQG